MKVTPRKDEVQAVVAVMESDEFETGEAMAKAVIKQVAELFAKRDWYAWVWRESDDSLQIAHGPLSSKVEAERLATKSGLKGRHMALPLFSTAALLERATAKPPAVRCADCTHPYHCHEVPRYAPKCWVKGCGCKALAK